MWYMWSSSQHGDYRPVPHDIDALIYSMLLAFYASLNAATINTEINHSMTWPTIEKGHGIKYHCSESTTKDIYQGPFVY